MSKQKRFFLDFTIDKLTKSIENRISGDSFATEVTSFTKLDLMYVAKKSGWLFDWKYELAQNEREVYKLTILGQSVIQGVVSLTPEIDNVYMHLIESAPFNRGKNKLYVGIPGNLVAFACKLSFQRGTQGYVSFAAKTKLIDHYRETLGATRVGGQLMILETNAALKLIERYFKE
jgi:hypothetical protein